MTEAQAQASRDRYLKIDHESGYHTFERRVSDCPMCQTDPTPPLHCPECGALNVSTPDDEGLRDCFVCGVWFSPDAEHIDPICHPAPESNPMTRADLLPRSPTCDRCGGPIAPTDWIGQRLAAAGTFFVVCLTCLEADLAHKDVDAR